MSGAAYSGQGFKESAGFSLIFLGSSRACWFGSPLAILLSFGVGGDWQGAVFFFGLFGGVYHLLTSRLSGKGDGWACSLLDSGRNQIQTCFNLISAGNTRLRTPRIKAATRCLGSAGSLSKV